MKSCDEYTLDINWDTFIMSLCSYSLMANVVWEKTNSNMQQIDICNSQTWLIINQVPKKQDQYM